MSELKDVFAESGYPRTVNGMLDSVVLAPRNLNFAIMNQVDPHIRIPWIVTYSSGIRESKTFACKVNEK